MATTTFRDDVSFHILSMLCYIFDCFIFRYEVKSKSNAFYFRGIITDIETYIRHQNKACFLRITSLLHNIVIVSLNSNVRLSNENMYPCLVKFCWLFFEPLQFSFSRHWQNVCLLNPLSCGRRDDSLKALNLVSMEDTVKLSPQTKRWSP